MDNIQIVDETTEYTKKVKYYTLDFNGYDVQVKKWWDDDQDYDEYNNDYVITNEDDIREEFSDESWEQLIEFICTLV